MCRPRRTAAAVVCPVALLAVLAAAALGASVPVATDEMLLKDNRVPVDGPGLLDYIRKLAGRAVSQEKLAALIEQLGDDSFEKREQASRELIRLGKRAKRVLEEALEHADLEIRSRAGRCLREIDKDDGVGVTVNAAAVRVLARLKPAGAVGVLLDYLAAVEDE